MVQQGQQRVCQGGCGFAEHGILLIAAMAVQPLEIMAPGAKRNLPSAQEAVASQLLGTRAIVAPSVRSMKGITEGRVRKCRLRSCPQRLRRRQ